MGNQRNKHIPPTITDFQGFVPITPYYLSQASLAGRIVTVVSIAWAAHTILKPHFPPFPQKIYVSLVVDETMKTFALAELNLKTDRDKIKTNLQVWMACPLSSYRRPRRSIIARADVRDLGQDNLRESVPSQRRDHNVKAYLISLDFDVTGHHHHQHHHQSPSTVHIHHHHHQQYISITITIMTSPSLHHHHYHYHHHHHHHHLTITT